MAHKTAASSSLWLGLQKPSRSAHIRRPGRRSGVLSTRWRRIFPARLPQSSRRRKRMLPLRLHRGWKLMMMMMIVGRSTPGSANTPASPRLTRITRSAPGEHVREMAVTRRSTAAARHISYQTSWFLIKLRVWPINTYSTCLIFSSAH